MAVASGVTIDRVGMHFSGDRDVVALDDVSFDVADREFVAIVGPSGCGKSTLLRIVSGLLEPTSGSVTVRGKTPDQARRDVEFGFVFQSPVLFPWLKALGNVLLPDHILDRGVPRTGQAPRILLGSSWLTSGSRASRSTIPVRCRVACGNGWPWPGP